MFAGNPTTNRRRNSLRLQGHDYSRSGDYFVTICTSGRRCILGEVVDRKVKLSRAGKIVESCWQEIPEHFPNTKIGTFQIMPNHLHEIVGILESPVGVASRNRTDSASVP